MGVGEGASGLKSLNTTHVQTSRQILDFHLSRAPKRRRRRLRDYMKLLVLRSFFAIWLLLRSLREKVWRQWSIVLFLNMDRGQSDRRTNSVLCTDGKEKNYFS